MQELGDSSDDDPPAESHRQHRSQGLQNKDIHPPQRFIEMWNHRG